MGLESPLNVEINLFSRHGKVFKGSFKTYRKHGEFVCVNSDGVAELKEYRDGVEIHSYGR